MPQAFAWSRRVFKPYYDRIVIAVGLGFVWLNGLQRHEILYPVYRTGNGGHLAVFGTNHAGRSIVGAGASVGGSPPRARVCTIPITVRGWILQGWGET